MDYLFQSANPRIKPVYFLAAVIIALLAGAVTARFRGQQKITKTQSAAVVLLTVYIFLVFASTVFSRAPKAYYTYELVPFWSYREILKGSRELFWENILNIVMLLPIGVLLPLACGSHSKKIFRRTVFAGFFTSLAIESLQLILKCGLFEIDDMFHNTVGVALGYWAYCEMRGIWEGKKQGKAG